MSGARAISDREIVARTSTGRLTDMKTTILMTSTEAKEAMTHAASQDSVYKRPGEE